jgi:hypothetical protein
MTVRNHLTISNAIKILFNLLFSSYSLVFSQLNTLHFLIHPLVAYFTLNNLQPNIVQAKTTTMKQFSLTLLSCLILLASHSQTTVTLTADKDNTIYSESNTLSNGAGANFFAGVTNNAAKRRALVHFDLSSIPAGATITSATLNLYVNKLASSSAGVNLYKLTQSFGGFF